MSSQVHTGKTVTRVKSKGKYYPRIEFSGELLEKMGFEYGDDILVTYDFENEVVIVKKR